jgi:hypothetical protein
MCPTDVRVYNPGIENNVPKKSIILVKFITVSQCFADDTNFSRLIGLGVVGLWSSNRIGHSLIPADSPNAEAAYRAHQPEIRPGLRRNNHGPVGLC